MYREDMGCTEQHVGQRGAVFAGTLRTSEDGGFPDVARREKSRSLR